MYISGPGLQKLIVYSNRDILKLEPICCKKGKKSLKQETALGNVGHLKVLNNTKLILNEHKRVVWPESLIDYKYHVTSWSKCSTCREYFTTKFLSVLPLFPKPVSWLRFSFAVSYSKLALVLGIEEVCM